MNLNQIKHIIIVDTAAFNEVAFDIIVNFERMLNRQIPNVQPIYYPYNPGGLLRNGGMRSSRPTVYRKHCGIIR